MVEHLYWIALDHISIPNKRVYTVADKNMEYHFSWTSKNLIFLRLEIV